jgi:hypothetical protein
MNLFIPNINLEFFTCFLLAFSYQHAFYKYFYFIGYKCF